jgi:acyl carrier protein
MERKRIRDETIEILCNKLHNLVPPAEDADFDYDHQALVPDITKDPLDIAEVTMDLEDAFGVNFENAMPGDPGMETIGKVVDYLEARINDPTRARDAKNASDAKDAKAAARRDRREREKSALVPKDHPHGHKPALAARAKGAKSR